jgi:hypothetical protein
MQERQRKFSRLVGEFLVWIYTQPDYSVVLGEVFRPQYVQDKMVAEGKSETKDGFHPKCLAIDLKLFIAEIYMTKTEDYRILGEYWESLSPDCVWGGRFGDDPNTLSVEGWDGGHFQYGGKESVKYYQNKGV